LQSTLYLKYTRLSDPTTKIGIIYCDIARSLCDSTVFLLVLDADLQYYYVSRCRLRVGGTRLRRPVTDRLPSVVLLRGSCRSHHRIFVQPSPGQCHRRQKFRR